MNTLASRFLSFEEALGAGLVKFAYFLLLAVLVVLTVVAMIGGIVMMFTVGFWAGLGAFLLAPVRFIVALILLRVATEVVLAILSIDDHLTDGARNQGALPNAAPAPAPVSVPTATPAPTVKSAPAPKPASKGTPAAKAKPAAKKTARKTTKKATTAGTASTSTTKKTADAAKAATRPSGTAPDDESAS